MQSVSQAYKDSMKKNIRNRGYIQVYLGMFNQDATNHSVLGHGIWDAARWTVYDNMLQSRTEYKRYGTLEQKVTRVAGKTTFFLPENPLTYDYIDTGFTTGMSYSPEATASPYLGVVDATNIAMMIDFRNDSGGGYTVHGIKGFTIDFGKDGDVGDVSVLGMNGSTVVGTMTGTVDADGKWLSNDAITGDVGALWIKVNPTIPYRRVRIYSLLFGRGLTYNDSQITDASQDMYESAICENLPQHDFSFSMTNYDKFFNVDNPLSDINFLETGQEMSVQYGYQLDNGTIEWVKGGTYLNSEWESDDNSVTIKGVDRLRQLEQSYNQKFTTPTNYGGMIREIMAEANLTEGEEYYIDSSLNTKTFDTLLPTMSAKEALQLIASATNTRLCIDRDGKICFKKPKTIFKYTNYTENVPIVPLDNYFEIFDVNGVYQSLQESDANGELYCYILVYENSGVKIGAVKYLILKSNAKSIYVGASTTQDGSWHETYNCADYPDGIYPIDTPPSTYEIKVIINSIDTPNSYFILNEFKLTSKLVSDDYFKVERTDMMSSPKAIKGELVKEIIVKGYTWTVGTTSEVILEQDLASTPELPLTLDFTEPCKYETQLTDYPINIDGTVYYPVLSDAGPYRCIIGAKLAMKGTGTIIDAPANVTFPYTKIIINGYKYIKKEGQRVISLNNTGSTVTIDNPLISSLESATDWNTRVERLTDYYKNSIEYEYDTRGNPELEVGDIIAQENDFNAELKVQITDVNLDYNGAFSGSMTTKKENS